MICYFWRTVPRHCRPGTKAVSLPTKPISGQSQPRLSHPRSSEESVMSMRQDLTELMTNGFRIHTIMANRETDRADDQMILASLESVNSLVLKCHIPFPLSYFVIQLHGLEVPNNDLVVVLGNGQVISKRWDALLPCSGPLSFVQRGYSVFWVNVQKPIVGIVESLIK